VNIVQCTFCRKPFLSTGGRICSDCNEQIDRDFITVRDYIYEHKLSNIDKISEETEVSRQIIIHLLKEGRLIIEGEDGGGVLFCESCKKPINTGRLCAECMGKASSAMSKNVTPPSKPSAEIKQETNLKGAAKIK
jgi:predicted amidophosphoribosyltransferase